MTRFLGVMTCVLVASVAFLLFAGTAEADIVVTPAEWDIVEWEGSRTSVLGAASDIDKPRLDVLKRWYRDANGNNEHDPGELTSSTYISGYTEASDNSCWLASGINLLVQAGLVGDGQSLYDDWAVNGVTVGGNTYTWADGGLQEYVVDYWKSLNPVLASQVTTEIHWAPYVRTSDYMFVWMDWNPKQETADYLLDGWEVGIGMWPNIGGAHAGGHALTLQSVLSSTMTVTDSDRDEDWNVSGDINSYRHYLALGTGSGHDYYCWYNDFYYSNPPNWYYPVGDVGYVFAMKVNSVPEPTSLLLWSGLGVMGLIAAQRRKQGE